MSGLDLDQAGDLTREDVDVLEGIADDSRGLTWSRIHWRLARRILRALRDLRAERDEGRRALDQADRLFVDVLDAIDPETRPVLWEAVIEWRETIPGEKGCGS